MKLLRPVIIIACIVTTFIANAGEQLTAKTKGAVDRPTAVELQLLEGTWEGVEVGDKVASEKPDFQKTGERRPNELGLEFLRDGVLASPQSHDKITITITGNSLHFHRDTNFWFETTITLPAGTTPKQLHATIKGCPPSQADSIGKVVGAIFKIKDGTLTLAAYDMSDEPPNSFEDAEDKRLTRYELRKVQPQEKNTQPPKTN